jgi:putative transcriptional regulator
MNKIGHYLKLKGRKQNWLAEQIGMSNNTINSYVKNRSQPNLETLIKIGLVLEIKVNLLIDTKVDKKTTNE